MYLLAKLDCFVSSAAAIGWGIFFAASLIALMILIIGSMEFEQDKGEKIRALASMFKLKACFITSVILLILGTLLPTTKQAAFIYIAPQIIENGAVKDTIKNIPELTKLGTDYLKELLQEKVNEQ